MSDGGRGENGTEASATSGSSSTTYQRRRTPSNPADETPFEELVRRMDEGLDEMERNPPAYARAWHSISTGPLGAATGAGVMKAAKVTAVVGGEAVRLAVPATKWALGVGLRMALGAVSAVEKQERRRKDGPPSEL